MTPWHRAPQHPLRHPWELLSLMGTCPSLCPHCLAALETGTQCAGVVTHVICTHPLKPSSFSPGIQRLSQHGDHAGPQSAAGPSSAGSKGSSCPSLFWHSRIIVQQDYIRLGVHSSTCKGTGMTGQMDAGMDKQPPWPRMAMAQAASVPTSLHVHTHQCQAVSHPSDPPCHTDCHPGPWSGHKHQCLLLPPGSWDWPAACPAPRDASGMQQPLHACAAPAPAWCPHPHCYGGSGLGACSSG